MAIFIANLGVSSSECRTDIAFALLSDMTFGLDIHGASRTFKINSINPSTDELTVQCENEDFLVTLHLPDELSAAAQATIINKRKES